MSNVGSMIDTEMFIKQNLSFKPINQLKINLKQQNNDHYLFSNDYNNRHNMIKQNDYHSPNKIYKPNDSFYNKTNQSNIISLSNINNESHLNITPQRESNKQRLYDDDDLYAELNNKLNLGSETMKGNMTCRNLNNNKINFQYSLDNQHNGNNVSLKNSNSIRLKSILKGNGDNTTDAPRLYESNYDKRKINLFYYYI